MSLLDLQRRFFDEIRSESAAAASATPGMRIYRNNYRAQLLNVLKDSFGKTRLWLGDEAFEAAAGEQIRKSPPESWTLDAYGRDFPAFLKRLYPNDPEVAELAWLDCALSHAFVTADVPAASAEELAATHWETVRLGFVPLQLAEAATNAGEIWRALEAGKMPPPGRRRGRRGGYVVWRAGYKPCFRVAEVREYRALSALYLGVPFAHVCASIERQVGQGRAIDTAGRMLGRWISDGLVARVLTSPTNA